MIQSWALLVDAYRELKAKKLFWITMMLSGLVVLAFGLVGINSKGLTIMWWEFPLPMLNTNVIQPSVFYKFVFVQLGVPIWLTWIASALALISTAGMIPDFIAGGAVEMTLSKPIGRLRLFLTKYCCGLLFVALQVAVFAGACFLVIGFRGHTWEWRLWLAVPIVLLCFSYLYCVCALVGLLTRSTIAALLLTILFWFLLFILNTVDAVMVAQRESSIVRLESSEKMLATREANVRKLLPADLPDDAARDAEVAKHPMVEYARSQVKDAQQSVKTWTNTARTFFFIRTVLPKTNETTALLNRNLLSMDELRKFMPQDDENDEDVEGPPKRRRGGPNGKVQDRIEAAMRSRSAYWVAGTSVTFEIVILGIACVVFCRRDF